VTPSEDDETMSRYALLKQKYEILEHDMERRKQAYITREVDMKHIIHELQVENQKLVDEKMNWMSTDSKVQKIRSLHNTVIKNIENVQSATAQVLHSQEVDLLRAFRARLYDMETELEKEKSKSGDTSEWVEKCRKLEAEVFMRKDIEIKLRQIIQDMEMQVRRLKGECVSEEENKEFIIKQLVVARKEVSRLKQMQTKLEPHSEMVCIRPFLIPYCLWSCHLD
jgi:hypothetical protein